MSEVVVDGFLADSVTAVDGKLYALGMGWNRIFVQAFPARHDRVGVGLLFHLGSASSTREHRFAVRVETPEGGTVTLGTGPGGPIDQIEGGFTAASDGDVTVPFAMQLDGLPLATPGRYAVVIALDGDDVKRLAFEVTSRGPAKTESEPPATGTAGYL
jgi:uncharacterized protein DUF6941